MKRLVNIWEGTHVAPDEVTMVAVQKSKYGKGEFVVQVHVHSESVLSMSFESIEEAQEAAHAIALRINGDEEEMLRRKEAERMARKNPIAYTDEEMEALKRAVRAEEEVARRKQGE